MNAKTMGTKGAFTQELISKSSRNGMVENPIVTWDKKIPNPMLDEFKKRLERKYNVKFDTYWDLHKWTIDHYTNFWEEIWNHFSIIHSKSYDQVLVKTGDLFTDNDWFTGARFNFAENCLRYRDDSVAIMYLDEHSNEESITYAQLFEKVKLYAAAFRKNGLKQGDRVSCYMSNRMECYFAMLATTSIGAIWGGPLPYYGARAATNIINMMEPKFLITVDSHTDEGIEYPLIDYLPSIVNGVPSLEKVILLVTKEDTRKRGLSNIPHCVYLEDFLKEGITQDGKVPDLVFEQLPFNHPICINFTSGTTGLPKGAVHSAGSILPKFMDYSLVLYLKKGDVMLTNYTVGWSLWDYYVPSLGLGIKIVLLCGNPYVIYNGKNYWDVCGKYKVNFTFLVTSMVDKMEKSNIVPSPGTNLDNLKIIGVGGSPVKKENFMYLQNKIKKDAFITSVFGTTEVFGLFSGCCLDMPSYGGEMQVPSFGVDMQCFDEKGNSVIGQRGELVICTRHPGFLTNLWKDKDNAKLIKTYLAKYPGVWCQNDECWINPKTKGLVVIGRSDDTLKQKGERFGSGDIYNAIHAVEELQDYICVGQNKYNGDSRAVLFVKMKPGHKFTPEMRAKIEKTVNDELWEDCVPELILETPEIPYNLNNKRMENVVRKIVQTNEIPEVTNIKNPSSLKCFHDIPEIVSYNQQ